MRRPIAHLRDGAPLYLPLRRRREWWEPLAPVVTALAGFLCLAGAVALLVLALILASPWGMRP